jgi:ribonuclease BN (tRNA processing enzyme)
MFLHEQGWQHNHGFPASGFVITWQGKKIAIITDTNARLNEQTRQALQDCDLLFADAFSENLEQVHGVYEDCGIEAPDLEEEWFHMTIPEVQALQTAVQARTAYTIHMSRHLAPHQQLVEQYQTDDFVIGYDGLTITF